MYQNKSASYNIKSKHQSIDRFLSKYDNNPDRNMRMQKGQNLNLIISENRNVKVCLNYSGINHISRFCSGKNKRFKFFKCNSFGHKAHQNKCSSQVDNSKLIKHIM